MGINKQSLSLLLHEHNYRPITGNYLSVAKHTVNIPIETIRNLFIQHHIPFAKLDTLLLNGNNIDVNTRHGKTTGNTIYDHVLLSAFSDSMYRCLDISDYEGASIIHDMNTPIPEHYYNTCDFIYNGSCMDNLFDPVAFLKNTANMLKPGGRIMHMECATAVAGAFLSFSPEWFFSYYAINDFKDCKIYVTVARATSVHPHIFETDVFFWQPYFTRTPSYDYIDGCKSVDGLMHVLVIAEKQENSTSNRIPIQSHYLQSTDQDWREKFSNYRTNNRPILMLNTKKDGVMLPLLTDHYQYIGSDF